MLAVGNLTKLRQLHSELSRKDWYMTLIDLKAFCAVVGHEVLSVEKNVDFLEVKIQKR